MTKIRILVCFAVLATAASLIALSQGRGGGRRGGTNPAASATAGPNWPTYGGNLASHRNSSADQINKDSFKNLRIAWRLKTDFLGPTPDNLYAATPLYVNGVLYTTAGTRRAAIALNPGTGSGDIRIRYRVFMETSSTKRPLHERCCMFITSGVYGRQKAGFVTLRDA